MTRDYYKEPDTRYGRPKRRTADRPLDFRTYDDEMKGWEVRQFIRELVDRQLKHDWKKHEGEWSEEPRTFEFGMHSSKERAVVPGLCAGGPWNFRGLIPLTDLDEINRFLCRPSGVSQIESAEQADNALRLGMILIAVDPNTPDLARRLGAEAEKIRKAHPLPIKKPPGRPSGTTDLVGIDANKLEQWRAHRILALHELRLSGYDPTKDRKQIAEWMFPEIKDQRKRGSKLDRAVEFLDEALAAARVIDAQTR
jgi:hypothetical protein